MRSTPACSRTPLPARRRSDQLSNQGHRAGPAHDADAVHGSLMSEQTSAALERTPLSRLIGERGPLTALEVFTAIAPNSDVPVQIVASHEKETELLGRASPEMLHLEFDAEVSVPKSVGVCQGFVWRDPGNSGDWTGKRFQENPHTASVQSRTGRFLPQRGESTSELDQK